ncbi:Peptidase S1 domain-containing protein [Sergentomyia squamirostris]
MSLRVLALVFVALATASAAKADDWLPLRIGVFSSGSMMCSAFALTKTKALVHAQCYSMMPMDIRVRPAGIPLSDSGDIYYANRIVYHPDRDYKKQQNEFAIVTLDREIKTENDQKLPTIAKSGSTPTAGQTCNSIQKIYSTTSSMYNGGVDMKHISLKVIDSAQCASSCGTSFTSDFICAEVTTSNDSSYPMYQPDNGSPLVCGKEIFGIATPEIYCSSNLSTPSSAVFAYRKIASLGDFVRQE